MAKFIPPEFLDDLPESPEEAWADAVDHCVSYIGEMVTDTSDPSHDAVVQREVVDFLSDLAKELRIVVQFRGATDSSKLRNIMTEATRIRSRQTISKISQRYGVNSGQDTPALFSAKTKLEIVRYSRELKSIVSSSDLNEKQKSRLYKRLDEFEQDLMSGQKSFRETLIAVSFIGAAIAGTTSTLADAPDAWETLGRISGLIAYEAEQEKELKLLTHDSEPLPLPAPSAPSQSSEEPQ